MKKRVHVKLPALTTANPILHGLLLLLLLLGLTATPSARAQSFALSNLWSMASSTNLFLNPTDNNTRGLAFNPATGHLLVVSRTVFNAVHVLNGATGAEVGILPIDSNLIKGGTFVMNMIGVTDDGVIYVGNLTTDATNSTTGPFRLYRWANEAAQPTLAYAGDPSYTNTVGTNPRRFGDSLALRGTGTGTQILLGTYNAVVGLLTTSNGTDFQATKITTDAGAEETRKCLAWGAGDTFWAKQTTGNLRLFSLNLAARTASNTTSIALSTLYSEGLDVDVSRSLAAIVCTNHTLVLYDIINPAAALQQDVTRTFPTPARANGNWVGCAALRNGKLFALDVNNGILAYSLYEVYLPPIIRAQPANVTIYEGASGWAFTVAATGNRGDPPLSYQWRFGGTDVAGATTSSLTISNTTIANQGYYSVVVTNAYGRVTSSSALMTVAPSGASDQMINIWDVAPTTRPYLNTNYMEYGVAINPLTTNVIVVTRTNNPTGTNMIAVLDIQTGAHKYYIDYSTLTLVGGSGIPMNKVCVADDGVIFVCNYTGDAASVPFAIYGFSDDNPVPAQTGFLFDSDPGKIDGTNAVISTAGWGSNIDARGGGANTEILIGAGKYAGPLTNAVAVLRYSDTMSQFVSTPILITNLPANNNYFRFGMCWGAGDTFWAKGLGGLMNVAFDRTTGKGWVTKTYPTTGARSVPYSVTGMAFDADTSLLAALENVSAAFPVSVRFYDVRDPVAGPFWVDQKFFSSYNAEIEWAGTVSFEKGYAVVLGVNNGLKAFKVNASFVASLPVILTQPAGGTWFEGTSPTLSVVADSLSTLSYQWYYYGTQAVSGATSATLTLTNIQASQAGDYIVRVSNSGGFRDSRPATMSVLPIHNTAQTTNIWNLAPGSRPYLNNNYYEYGMAFNPANSNLVVASYVSTNATPVIVAVVDALTGAHKNVLDVSVVSGGNRPVSKVGVADDGVVYVGNRTTSPATVPFVLYRWANDQPATVATIAYSGDPSPSLTTEAVGYTMDVRGAGANTQILLGLNVSNVVCILTTTDGLNFTAKEVFVPGAPATFARLGLCWGAGNTFWAKMWRDQGGQTFLVQYDLAAGTGTVLRTYSTAQVASTITTVAYNDSLKFLAGIAHDGQQNVQIYSVADLDWGPELLDQKLFPTYNASIEANGALDFGGNSYLFALDENNGVMAFQLNPSYLPPVTHFKILSATTSGGTVLLTWQAQNGTSYQVQYADALDGTPRTNWTNLGSPIVATGSTASFTNTVSGSKRFYQVIAQ